VPARPVFYFDFNSPYAYLAAERIDDLIPDAEWRPIAFPILLHQLGRLEAAITRDRSHVVPEISQRIAERGLPALNPPQGWPLESWSLVALRAAVFAGQAGRMREFSRAAYRRMFVDGRSLTELATVREAAVEAGLDAAELEAAVERPDIKDRLKEQTDEALAMGVTGIPTFAIGDELFWGDDHLDEAAAAARAS
jgi:2-hydroxychromene-2-carboxylate isomerase